MTSPNSKLRYKVTYPNGNEKWVRERPGHKSDKLKVIEKKKWMRKPVVKDFFKKMEAVINKYLGGEAVEKDIEKVARDFETTIGWNKARMVIRRLAKTERHKIDKLDGDKKDHQQKISDALKIAVDFVARRRRDKPKKASDAILELVSIAKEVLDI